MAGGGSFQQERKTWQEPVFNVWSLHSRPPAAVGVEVARATLGWCQGPGGAWGLGGAQIFLPGTSAPIWLQIVGRSGEGGTAPLTELVWLLGPTASVGRVQQQRPWAPVFLALGEDRGLNPDRAAPLTSPTTILASVGISRELGRVGRQHVCVGTLPVQTAPLCRGGGLGSGREEVRGWAG